jgi:hypothetical protein
MRYCESSQLIAPRLEGTCVFPIATCYGGQHTPLDLAGVMSPRILRPFSSSDLLFSFPSLLRNVILLSALREFKVSDLMFVAPVICFK